MTLRRHVAVSLVALAAAAAGGLIGLTPMAVAQTPMGTAFTYQGRLDSGGTPYTGLATIDVSLWDAVSGGHQIGLTSTHPFVQVNKGIFTVSPDFGAAAFNGQARWVEITVTPVGFPGGTTLSPRQLLSPTPYALQTRGLFVDGGGNLGLGTTNPAATLDVVGSTPFPHLRIAARDSASTPYGSFLSLDASPVSGGKNWLIYSTTTAAGEGAGKLILRNLTDNAQGVAIAANGNLGIGTYEPNLARLQIVSSASGINISAADYGVFITTAGDGVGLQATSGSAPAVKGIATDSSGVYAVGNIGVEALGIWGVDGEANTSGGTGVHGTAPLGNGTGVYGSASGGGFGVGVYGSCGPGTSEYAGFFSGKVQVLGTLAKSGGSFKIDHPLDPANKFLSHSFVESPDMMNVYNGNVVTDAAGYATIMMPEWFQTLNRDFRYQLTVIDAADSNDFVQAKIVRPMANNQFTLRTSRPGTTVSWQVTGIRQDAWANAHRIPVEHEKVDHERGRYLAPLEHGMPEEFGIDYQRIKRAREGSGK